MSCNSSDIIGAARDPDLRLRAVALAAEMGIPNPEPWVDGKMYQLASSPTDDVGGRVAAAHAYATAVYKDKLAALPPRPGQNPAAVTDDHLRYALNTLRSSPTN